MKLYFVVKGLLQDSPELRDSDKLLIWKVWEKTGFATYGNISRSAFLKAPHTESIRRLRQKLQEKYPDLRSSPQVEALKEYKESMAGNFVYQERIDI